MVCGFCPGSGSPAEKSFNRADVFKRHLTSVHGVEQTPPNCRKRSPGPVHGGQMALEDIGAVEALFCGRAGSRAEAAYHCPPGLGKKGTNYSPDATGKCSTCSSTFSNAQDFYEELVDRASLIK
jgi:hypothetical protein